MKKRTYILLAAGCMSAMLLMACTNNNNPTGGASSITLGGATQGATGFVDATSTPAPTQAESSDKFTAADIKVVVNDVTIKLGEDFLPNVDKVGKLTDKLEGQACLESGKDINYYYDGFNVCTMTKDDKQLIYNVDVTKEGYKDAKGIEIGKSTEAELFEAYGTPAENEKLRRVYTAGNYNIIFYVENNIVTEIELLDKSVN